MEINCQKFSRPNPIAVRRNYERNETLCADWLQFQTNRSLSLWNIVDKNFSDRHRNEKFFCQLASIFQSSSSATKFVHAFHGQFHSEFEIEIHSMMLMDESRSLILRVKTNSFHQLYKHSVQLIEQLTTYSLTFNDMVLAAAFNQLPLEWSVIFLVFVLVHTGYAPCLLWWSCN